VNSVVIVVKVLLANVLDLVLENRVKRIPTADQMNSVVLMEPVSQLVLKNLVPLIATAHQVNLVVIVISDVVNVVDLVLENHVERIPTADQVNPVVVLIMTDSVSVLVLENRVTRMTIVLLGNVVMLIRNVKQIAT
jgi:hypothetical protein